MTADFRQFALYREKRSQYSAVPAVVLKHVEGGVSEKGGTRHGQIARVLLRVVKLLHHNLTVPQKLIQTELPVGRRRVKEQFKDTRNAIRMSLLALKGAKNASVDSRSSLNLIMLPN